MKAIPILVVSVLIFALVLVSACSSGAAQTEAPPEELMEIPAEAAVAPPSAPTALAAPVVAGNQPSEAASVPASYQPSPNRLIIKNAELTLVVLDTDVAINRLTQAVADQGGYIISSEIWFQDWNEEAYKYATVTLAVPVDRFEDSLNRLRGLAEKVQNEVASGQDVTDEYVDLDSRLENLKATRDRIREFLDQAKNVEEALKVNEQLKGIEDEIEQVQGRMNYLFDRAAYSTVTVHLEPVLPEIEPTPTPTPSPTPTPKPWKPGETAGNASRTLGTLARGLVDVTIWLLVVFVPLLLPVALVAWLIWWLVQRRKAKQAAKPAAPDATTPPTAPPA